MKRHEGKVALCAGSATGMGAASARRLGAEGAKVVIGDINLAGAQGVAEEIIAAGGEALAVEFDISQEGSVAGLFAATVDHFGGLDLMHCNAADLRAVRRDFDACAVDLEIFDRSLAVNLRGHLLCTRFAIPAMLKRGKGVILYTSSGAAHSQAPDMVSYYVSKAGLNALMRHVALRWGKENIRANAICPGAILSETLKKNWSQSQLDRTLGGTPSTRLGEPEDIADAAAFLLSDEAAWINGQAISVNGGAQMKS